MALIHKDVIACSRNKLESLEMEKAIKIIGTLVMGVFYNQGVVLAADTGGSIDIGDEEFKLRNQRKVALLKGGAVVGASGNAVILDPDNPEVQWFNAIALTQEYFSRTTFQDTVQFWDGLKVQVLAVLNQYIQASGDTDPTSLEMIFLYLDQQQVIRMKYSSVKYDGASPATMKIKQESTPPIICIGYSNVLDDLLKTAHKFVNLRKHASVKPFTQGRLRFEEITLDRAMLFIKKIMEVSSIVEPSKGHVSAKFVSEILLGKVNLTMP